ncbi:hypothetical protein BaRGS_00001328 [Batillaria attramentaria]|uniref:Uncharacterized protein n=1 Tax=Batillaria attramentaria TaxID=370345 RepID=A0ABD0M837_9CAEN
MRFRATGYVLDDAACQSYRGVTSLNHYGTNRSITSQGKLNHSKNVCPFTEAAGGLSFYPSLACDRPLFLCPWTAERLPCPVIYTLSVRFSLGNAVSVCLRLVSLQTFKDGVVEDLSHPTSPKDFLLIVQTFKDGEVEDLSHPTSPKDFLLIVQTFKDGEVEDLSHSTSPKDFLLIVQTFKDGEVEDLSHPTSLKHFLLIVQTFKDGEVEDLCHPTSLKHFLLIVQTFKDGEVEDLSHPTSLKHFLLIELTLRTEKWKNPVPSYIAQDFFVVDSADL